MLSAIQEFLDDEIESNDGSSTTVTADSNEMVFSRIADNQRKVVNKNFGADSENPNMGGTPCGPRCCDRRNRPFLVLGTILVGLAVMVGVAGSLYHISKREWRENTSTGASSTVEPDIPTEYYQVGGSGQNTEELSLSPTSSPLESSTMDKHAIPDSTKDDSVVIQSPTPEPTHPQQMSNSPFTSRPKPKQKTKKPSLRPTSAPTNSPVADTTPIKEHTTFSFYVMGDVPYNRVEKLRLRDQLEEITDDAPDNNALFIVHVGDIFTAEKEACVADTYEEVADIFLDNSPLPTFILPGDNDWADCEDPDTALTRWSNTFLNFEENWSDINHVPKRVKRQSDREENFAFKYDGVLFLGFNIIGGEETWENTYEWSTRFQDCYYFAEEKINEQDDSLRAVIFFGHAFKFKKLLNMVAQTAESMGVPSMYIHGDGHKWSFRQPFDESNFWKIQVDQGGEAPPLKVTVFGSEEAALSDSHSTSKFTVANFISVDRRGGLYESDATS